MKSSNFAKNSFLKIRLKTEKFIKEQLWQLLLVVAIILFFAWIFEKYFEAICFCIAHIVIRRNFELQYHSKATSICLLITTFVIFFGIILCIPISLSLLSSIPIAFLVCLIGYLVQYKIEKEKPKTFNANACTETELINRCRELNFSEENTKLAVLFFIKKLKHREIASMYCIEEDSVTKAKYRMKKLLNKVEN